MDDPSPATVTEQFLAAILNELRALRVTVVAGQVDAARRIDEALSGVADAIQYTDGSPVSPEPAAPPNAVSSPPQSATKRTRARPR